MKYILQVTEGGVGFSEYPFNGLDPKRIPDGCKLEWVKRRYFGERAGRIKRWVVDLASLEELQSLMRWAADRYGVHSNLNSAIVIMEDSELEYPIIQIYNDYIE